MNTTLDPINNKIPKQPILNFSNSPEHNYSKQELGTYENHAPILYYTQQVTRKETQGKHRT